MTVIVNPFSSTAPRSGERLAVVATPDAATKLVLDSQHLLQGRNEVLIRHGDEVYRLRHTRNDKLILTK